MGNVRPLAVGDALRSIRGMFALAAWDPRTRRLLLARDPLGIVGAVLGDKPLGWYAAAASVALVGRGDATTTSRTPATRAVTAVIRTDDGSGWRPPGA